MMSNWKVATTAKSAIEIGELNKRKNPGSGPGWCFVAFAGDIGTSKWNPLPADFSHATRLQKNSKLS